ncbi:unnamed protein product (macronuclear) [Paramecium tetraurelia]|uniref:Uncharacterized protein n=1 Tax=Paramecium tetraurelia TaxID=5888 RepID=A0D639_PARTE|nr:uncharacterized protein GSPATT00013936001 [Paramecium tetraurelia]CAK78506.1 unnamed protein product [Paramecium tetraurelia]|eukprot:XP_001445903.1 hypothetical protein (macronuclear) [Paramecium tetraurelia strain d4-2]
MNEQLRFIKLEESIEQLSKSFLPHLNQISLMQQKLSTLDVFITNNPRVDLISDTIQLLNSQLKIQERLSSIESQHSKFSSHYDEILNRHSVYIMQIQPWIDEMHSILEEAKQNREVNNQMRINFKEMNQKHKEYTGLLLQNDRLTQNYKTRLDQFETQLASKIDHSEITKVQDLMRRDFVTCLELDNIKNQIQQRIDRLQGEMSTKQQLGIVQDNIQFVKDRQVSVLTELVDKKVEDLANSKLKVYATKNDQRLFEDRINQVCKILSEKILMVQKETTEAHKLMQEQIKEENQQLNDLKSQLHIVNSTFQKVVMKDELQIAMQKTLRLQRESEYLNEKLESISAEIFEQKVSFQAFNKQKNLEIQTLQHQLVQKEGESVTYCESPKRAEVSQEEVESAQSSPRKKIRKSAMLTRQGSIINSDMMQRIFQRSDARIQELQNQLDEIRQRFPKASKFQENITQPVSDTINIRMEYFNQMIIQLLEETKKFKTSFDLLNQQIIAINSKPQIKEETLQQIDERLRFIQELEFKLDQKCDSSLVIPILDSKANAQEFMETKLLSKQLKQCVLDTINSLRTFFTSDQNDQIKDLLINQLSRYLCYFVRQIEGQQQQQQSDSQQNPQSTKFLQPKYTAQRMKSYSSCSKRRETDCEIRGRAVNRNITETAVYNSLRSSPLAFKLVNQNKQSATIVKRMKVQ